MSLLHLCLSFALLPAFASLCDKFFEYSSTDSLPAWRYTRVASTESGALYLSQFAREKSHKVDKSLTELVGRAKVFGFGLTRRSDREEFVEDFISPSFDRILWMDDSELPSELDTLPEVLVNSPLLALAVQGAKLAVRSARAELLIDLSHWSFFRPILEKLTSQEWPHNFWLATKRVETQKVLALRSDWEMAVTQKNLVIANRFLARAQEHANRLGLEMRFLMHLHPRPAGSMREPGSNKEALDHLLKPSALDLFSVDRIKVDWLEIRTPGSAAELHSGRTSTARFFDMRELRALREEFTPLWDDLQHATNEYALMHLERNFEDLALQAEYLCVPLDHLAWYALGTSKFQRLRSRAKPPREPDTLTRERILFRILWNS